MQANKLSIWAPYKKEGKKRRSNYHILLNSFVRERLTLQMHTGISYTGSLAQALMVRQRKG